MFKTSANPVNLQQGTTRQVNKDLYAPYFDHKNPPAGGHYVAYLRFLPNMLKPESPIVWKKILTLGDPMQPDGGQQKKFFDHPETVGQRDNVASTLFWDLMNTKDEFKKKLARSCCGSYTSYYAFVQIFADPNIPNLEPYSIKLFRFGKVIFDKINSENENESNPFDLISGRVFKLDIYQEYGQNKYDKSCFVNTKSLADKGISNEYCYLGGDGNYYRVNDQLTDEVCDSIEVNLLDIQKSMDTDVMQYHPWSEEDEQLITQRCNLIRSVAYPDMYANSGTTTGSVPTNPMAQPSVAAPAAQTMQTAAPRPMAAPMTSAPMAAAPRPAAPVAAAPMAAAPMAAPTVPSFQTAAPASAPASFDDNDLNALLADDNTPF